MFGIWPPHDRIENFPTLKMDIPTVIMHISVSRQTWDYYLIFFFLDVHPIHNWCLFLVQNNWWKVIHCVYSARIGSQFWFISAQIVWNSFQYLTHPKFILMPNTLKPRIFLSLRHQLTWMNTRTKSKLFIDSLLLKVKNNKKKKMK